MVAEFEVVGWCVRACGKGSSVWVVVVYVVWVAVVAG